MLEVGQLEQLPIKPVPSIARHQIPHWFFQSYKQRLELVLLLSVFVVHLGLICGNRNQHSDSGNNRNINSTIKVFLSASPLLCALSLIFNMRTRTLG